MPCKRTCLSSFYIYIIIYLDRKHKVSGSQNRPLLSQSAAAGPASRGVIHLHVQGCITGEDPPSYETRSLYSWLAHLPCLSSLGSVGEDKKVGRRERKAFALHCKQILSRERKLPPPCFFFSHSFECKQISPGEIRLQIPPQQ